MDRRGICKAFGNEDRLRMIRCLSRPKSVTDLLGQCSLSQSALSQHLKILRDAGIVASRRSGKQVWYRVADRQAPAIARLLLHYK